jgi:hypothetical protein
VPGTGIRAARSGGSAGPRDPGPIQARGPASLTLTRTRSLRPGRGPSLSERSLRLDASASVSLACRDGLARAGPRARATNLKRFGWHDLSRTHWQPAGGQSEAQARRAAEGSVWLRNGCSASRRGLRVTICPSRADALFRACCYDRHEPAR